MPRGLERMLGLGAKAMSGDGIGLVGEAVRMAGGAGVSGVSLERGRSGGMQWGAQPRPPRRGRRRLGRRPGRRPGQRGQDVLVGRAWGGHLAWEGEALYDTCIYIYVCIVPLYVLCVCGPRDMYHGWDDMVGRDGEKPREQIEWSRLD